MLEIEEVGIQINWPPNYLKLINLIKENPVIYTLGDYPKTKADRQNEIYAWENIERIMQCSRYTLHKVWNVIKLQYLKLNILIEAGTLSRGIIKEHAIANKYFDGSLSFLDSYLDDLTNLNILKNPTNKAFDYFLARLCKGSSNQSCTKKENKVKKSDLDPDDLKYIMNVVSVAVQSRFNAMFLAEETMNKEMSFTLESKLEVDKSLGPQLLSTVGKDILTDHNNADVNNIEREKEKVFNVHTMIPNDNECRKDDQLTIDDATNLGVSDDKIREYFRKLGLVLSQGVSLEKQKKLQIRINTLIKGELSL
ncbi:uncharacterized protein LOC113501430 isoform X2 [Trichoplusia ni]|uniref:Uncharacterized protein LOC113501430 isoform X2 n=1 Tax=Trichoplusia ni TaxID=7111 RepID=A0A7E5WCB4_TRINI|nr:uncharacterized protein LOC113501430 isoform X2 [Trichoplusia ni]